jgi:hypothetical protein
MPNPIPASSGDASATDVKTPEGATDAGATRLVPNRAASRKKSRTRKNPLPIIDVQEGDLAVVADQAWRAVERMNVPPRLFRNESGIVEIPRSGSELAIGPVGAHRLHHELVRMALWLKRTKHGNLTVRSRPPRDLVDDMLARVDPPLPLLKGVRTGPYVTAEGAIHLTRGYNAASGLVYDSIAELWLPPVPRNPTAAQLAHARRLILEPLTDFPFVSDADRAHAVGLMFLPFVEQLIDGALPAHAIDKPVRGTGAGLLTDVLLWPALGCRPAKMTEGNTEDEWRKRLFAKLLQGSFVICVDNIRRRLDSAALASALTEMFVEDRLLGFSRIARVDARRILVFTGNNLRMSDEVGRRTIQIRLDPQMERPETRNAFRHPDLRGWMARHRAAVVHAILTAYQAWAVAEYPQSRRAQTLGSFEAWAQVIGSLLDSLDIPGFLSNLSDAQTTTDPDELIWKSVLAAWWITHEGREIGVSELWTLLQANPDILAGLDLGDGSETALRTRLGLRLVAMRDRVFDGRRLENARSVQGANRWRLVPMPSA